MEAPTESMAQLALDRREGSAAESAPEPVPVPGGGELADPSAATDATAAGPGSEPGPTAAERTAGSGQDANGTATSESSSSSSSLSASLPASVSASAASASHPALNGHRASSSSGAMPNDDDAAPSASSSSSQPSNAIKAATIQAIKSRDFASSPPPARPAPTALGKSLSAGVPPHAERGLASESAVHTLASSTAAPAGAAGAMAAGRSASAGSALTSASGAGAGTPPMSGTGTPRTGGQPAAAGPAPGAGLRRAGSGAAGLAARIPPSLQAKMAAMASRSNNPTSLALAQNTHIGATERLPTASLLRSSSAAAGMAGGGLSAGPAGGPPGGPSNPPFGNRMNAPVGGAPGRVGAMGPVAGRGPIPGGPGGMSGLAKRRGPGGGLNLAQINGGGEGGPAPNGRANRPQMRLSDANGGTGAGGAPGGSASSPSAGGAGTPFANFSKIVDPSGSLNFQNKAVLHAKGVDFSNGSSFAINMGELELQEELGSGNYGTVSKVYHKVTKVTMAMKEIRLELDDSKLKGIITELDILHRATGPEIVEFYGAFFIESCVYYCMEYMDAGSLDGLAGCNIPEPVLQRVTASMVRGLKFLKDELQTMHRDVKPTNVLVNSAGAIKLCDFGVSGQLERSLAKTNIGCQSYMAPERIKGESQNFLGTYTVSSDVWSLGLSIIEFVLGHYPYPPETYSNVFAQLQAIVHGDPPALPDGYSKVADDFVARCLHKDAIKRPSYAQLLQHPFLRDEPTMDIDMAGWVKAALAEKKEIKERERTASASSASSTASSA